MKNVGVQICQICSDNVGKTVDADRFVACDVCEFPVCKPCYEFERKDGNQSCPQYKRHKDEDEATVELSYPQKEKIFRADVWHLTRGKEDRPEYDKEVSHNHLPCLTSRQDT
ncbi:unnamed protein product [Brassica rapa subsp. narinosa]|uniref:Cellulose synthase RING-type zinc finger domain-containing protein n=2 Tax=Brassica oleracea TaxID=3712 RepID=A0A0D3B1A4_BRAOL|nr:PREDICTED: cellulose synthase A catalytic subunit 3 [UDP-forming]-like [Brassica oleracea var. oleracea]